MKVFFFESVCEIFLFSKILTLFIQGATEEQKFLGCNNELTISFYEIVHESEEFFFVIYSNLKLLKDIPG